MHTLYQPSNLARTSILCRFADQLYLNPNLNQGELKYKNLQQTWPELILNFPLPTQTTKDSNQIFIFLGQKLPKNKLPISKYLKSSKTDLEWNRI
jgi:hypothetical protein